MASFHRNRTVTNTEVGTREWDLAVQAWPWCLLEEYGARGDFGLERRLDTLNRA